MVTMKIDDRDLADVIRRYDSVKKHASRVGTRQFRAAALPYISRMILQAPRATRTVHRYSTPKLSNKLRAPKGRGVKVATYKPGNMARSFADLRLRRVRGGIVIGPNVRRKDRPDGYYARFREDHDPFVGAIWMQSRPIVRRRIIAAYERAIKRAVKRMR